MAQKVIKVGSSAAVTLSREFLDELGVSIGDSVALEVDKSEKAILIRSIAILSPKDAKIAKLTMNFINRYREDLETLAKE